MVEPARVVVHPEDTWVEEGKRVGLRCLAAGDEPITYKWFKGNAYVSSSAGVVADESNLVIDEAIPEDAQSYHCQVSNYPDAKPDKSKQARIEVYSKLRTK